MRLGKEGKHFPFVPSFFSRRAIGDRRATNYRVPVTDRLSTRTLHMTFLFSCLLTLAMGRSTLHAWVQSAENGEWIIPLISAFLCYERRKDLFPGAQLSIAGVVPFILGLTLGATRIHIASLSLAMLGLAVAVSGAFLACYGWKAFSRARFPLLFLLFAVPIPPQPREVIVRAMQAGSAEACSVIFRLLQVPFLRDGLSFQLSSVSIEIAPECSGIRSSFALFVLSVLLAQLCLHSRWRRAALLMAVLPLAIVKNGIRIATITLLAEYVDRSFLDGPLHRNGGFLFFSLVFAAEGALCWWLRRSEENQGNAEESGKALEQGAVSSSRSSVGDIPTP